MFIFWLVFFLGNFLKNGCRLLEFGFIIWDSKFVFNILLLYYLGFYKLKFRVLLK